MASIRRAVVGGVAAAAVAFGVAGPAVADTKPTQTAQADAARSGAGPVTAVQGNPYTPRGVCGSSYSVVDDPGGIGDKAKRPVSYRPRPHQPVQVWGYVYLLYSNATGKNCVVSLKKRGVGENHTMSALLQVKPNKSKQDKGSYKYYAGPVKLEAAGQCVRYTSNIRITSDVSASGGRIDWGNCGG